ncbi:hypothetical protein J6590_106906, partial [Homalodisca vitripennis]
MCVVARKCRCNDVRERTLAASQQLALNNSLCKTLTFGPVLIDLGDINSAATQYQRRSAVLLISDKGYHRVSSQLTQFGRTSQIRGDLEPFPRPHLGWQSAISATESCPAVISASEVPMAHQHSPARSCSLVIVDVL